MWAVVMLIISVAFAALAALAVRAVLTELRSRPQI